MPLALIILGGIVLLVAIRNTHADLGKLLVEDFTGSQGAVGFFVWLAAIGFVGALGWVPALKTPSRILLAIIVIGMVFSNMGVFDKLKEAIINPPSQTKKPADVAATVPDAFPVNVGGGGQQKSAAGGIGSIAKAIPVIGGLFG